MQHRALAIIPARGGSKRIPRKNLIELGGNPLIYYSIKSAQKSKYLKNMIFVSTEDPEISEVAEKYGAKIIKRPKRLATDKASTLSVLKDAVKVLEKNLFFDTIVLLQPTSPFRKTSTINAGIEKLWGNWDKFDTVFSVRPSKFPPNWMLQIKNEKLEFVLPNDFSKIRHQDLEKTYEIDGVIYVFKKEVIQKTIKYPFVKNRTGFILTNKIESLDIDDLEDLEIARVIAAN